MLKNIIFVALLSSIAIFADTNANDAKESFSFCIKEEQKIDTNNWITFPISFKYFDNESTKEENIQISLPTEPKFVREKGFQPSHFTATDQDGMVFNLAAMQIPEENFDLQNSVDSMIESLSKSSSKKLIAHSSPYPNPNDSGYMVMWVENDKMIRLTLIKSAHFVYFLETSIHRDIYRDVEAIEMDTEAFDLMIKDSLKTGSFTKSLVIDSSTNS